MSLRAYAPNRARALRPPTAREAKQTRLERARVTAGAARVHVATSAFAFARAVHVRASNYR